MPLCYHWIRHCIEFWTNAESGGLSAQILLLILYHCTSLDIFLLHLFSISLGIYLKPSSKPDPSRGPHCIPNPKNLVSMSVNANLRTQMIYSSVYKSFHWIPSES